MTTYHLRGTDGTEVFTGTIEPPPGGGSNPGIALAVVDFQETAGAGTYTAEVPLAAGAIVGGTLAIPLAGWDADEASLNAGDTLTGPDSYLAGVSIKAPAPVAITAVVSTGPYSITAVNQGAKTFTVAGDHTPYVPPGLGGLAVSGSTGNDGSYTVESAVFGSGHTVFTVAQAIPNATADGALALDDGTITVAGNQLGSFGGVTSAIISGSTGNDGTYPVSNVAFDGTNTVISAANTLPDATADGTITAAPTSVLTGIYNPANVSQGTNVQNANGVYSSNALSLVYGYQNLVYYVSADAITVTLVTSGAGGTSGHLRVLVMGSGFASGVIHAVKS